MSSASEALAATTGVKAIQESGMTCALPEDVEQARSVLAHAASENIPVLPLGLGSKLALCRPEWLEHAPGIAISTRRMQSVVEYVAGDGTITAEAGATMFHLAETVTSGGHRLTPDVPLASASTLGGTLAAGLSGVDRLRNGPVRHHVLGITALLSDGTLARSGGRLVKNVTGFDLHRLYTGSRGTLCLILEASLRLFPEPEAEFGYTLACKDLAEGLARASALRDANLPALALALESSSAGVQLSLVLAGRHAQLVDAEKQLHSALPGAHRKTGLDAVQLRERLREAAATEGAWPQLRIVAPVPAFGPVLAAVRDSLGTHGLAPRLLLHPAVGLGDLFLPELPEAPDHQRILQQARGAATQAGGRLDPLQLPSDMLANCANPAGGDAASRWSAALASRFDPKGLFTCSHTPVRRP